MMLVYVHKFREMLLMLEGVVEFEMQVTGLEYPQAWPGHVTGHAVMECDVL